jgi:two-component system NtrC family response regulator
MADILIIDDDPVTSETLTDMVKRSGHEAFSAYSISDGIAYIHSRPFDVVFLDVQLPDGNGLDALPEIQAAPSRPEVVIITGFGNPDGAELAIKNGAWDYIEKPISLKTPVQRGKKGNNKAPGLEPHQHYRQQRQDVLVHGSCCASRGEQY